MTASFTASGVAKQLDYCTYCPKMCRHACPVSHATGRETLIPQAKMDRLNQARKQRVPWTVDSLEPIWGCTGCRHCTVYCEHDNEPGLVLLSGRAQANARGAGHPRLNDYPDRFRSRDQRLVTRVREHVGIERFSEDGAVGFWPGCDAIDKGLSDITAALSVFDRIAEARATGGEGDSGADRSNGGDGGSAGDGGWAQSAGGDGAGDDGGGRARLADRVQMVDAGQVCAGYPLLAAGYPDMFRWHASKVALALEKYRTVILNCSACLYTLRALYPAEGLTLSTQIISVAEFLAGAARALPKPARRPVVYYHDPCYLARYADVTREPRQVLSRVAEVRELSASGVETECCGGGGLLPKTMPDVADAMARRRLRDLAEHGGGTVVTACATCAFMLGRNAPSGVRVRELARFVAQVTAATPAGTTAPGR